MAENLTLGTGIGASLSPTSPMLSPMASLNSQSFEEPVSVWKCVACGIPVHDLYCLPCLHPLALCSTPECMERVRRNQVNCPDCAETFSIQPETLSRQPFASRKALQRVGRAISPHTNCQEQHENDKTATSYCQQCSSALCSACDEQHRKMIASRGHVVLPLSSLTVQPPEELHSCGSRSVRLTIVTCPEHGKVANLFCYKCECLVCDLCVSLAVGRHNHHKVSLLDEGLKKEQKSYLYSYFESVENIMQKLTRASLKIADSRDTLAERSEQAKMSIRSMAEELINGIVSRRDELCEEVDQIAQAKEQQLDTAHRELASILRRFVQFQKVSGQILEEGFPEEQLAIKRNFFQRVKSLHKMAHNVPLNPPVSPSVNFFRNESIATVQGNIHSLGYVCLGPDPQLCTVELDGSLYLQDAVRMQRNEPLWFMVKTRNPKREPCHHGGEAAEALLVPVSTGAALKGYTEDLEDGVYRFSFCGVPAEECLLTVHINGQPVANVPKFYRFLDFSCKKVISAKQMGYDRPTSLALSRFGTLAATDEHMHQVCMFDKQGNFLKAVGRGKGKEMGQFQEWMRGVAFNSRGVLAVSDSDNNRIQLFDASGKFMKLVGETVLRDPRCLAFNNNDHLFVLNSNEMFIFNDAGELKKCLKNLDRTGKGKLHQFAIGPDGLLYIIDKNNTAVLVFTQEGELLKTFGTYGKQRGLLYTPCGVAATRDGFVVVTSHHKVSIFRSDGTFVHEIGYRGEGVGAVNGPLGVAVDDKGYIYVADRNNYRIQVF